MPNSFFVLFLGEPLHGYRLCIQAVLQDKPKTATPKLPEVSVCLTLNPADNWQIAASLPLSDLNVLEKILSNNQIIQLLFKAVIWAVTSQYVYRQFQFHCKTGICLLQ